MVKKLGKCRIIFFDLEFYVPESSRNPKGFSYNPYDENCRFIGGEFLVVNPYAVGNMATYNLKRKIKSFWLWNYNSEEELLEGILNLLKETGDLTRNAHDGQASALLCGIGITTSDVPILCNLFNRFNLLSNQDTFTFLNSFRIMDLSQGAIGTFNCGNNLLYPLSKNHLTNKFLHGKIFPSGENVWQLYEDQSYDQIESRVKEEVIATYDCYVGLLEEIREQNRAKKICRKEKKNAEREKSVASGIL